MNPTKTPAVQCIESLLFASYCAFLGASSPASAKTKLQEWDSLCVATVQTTKTYEEIQAVLGGTRSGSDTQFIILGRLLDTATTLERYVFVHRRAEEMLQFAENRENIFSENTMKVRAAKLRTLTEQIFHKWDEAALKKLGKEASREQAQTISRLCPSGGKTAHAIADRLATIATEEERLEKAEEEATTPGDQASKAV